MVTYNDAHVEYRSFLRILFFFLLHCPGDPLMWNLETSSWVRMLSEGGGSQATESLSRAPSPVEDPGPGSPRPRMVTNLKICK